MREALAWMVCLLALCVVTLLSYAFAVRHNRPSPVRPMVAAQTPPPDTEERTSQPSATDAGRKIFESRNCGTCHSVAGTGNPRNPLDGVGSRLDIEQLRDWTTGTGSASNSLSAGVRGRKARYSEMSQAEMEALLHYLSALKSEDVQQVQ